MKNNYQKTFQLAQEKGYKLFFHPEHKELYSDEEGNPYIRQILIECTLIQKWLRDKYDIHIIIRPGFGEPRWYDWLIVGEIHDIVSEDDESYPTYEEALSIAIYHGLNLLP